MQRKSVNKLYKELLEEITDEYKEEEKAACIMKKIAEERNFSSRYYWSSKKIREKMYRRAANDKGRKLTNRKQLICVTATKIFIELAEKFGLDVYVIGDKELTQKDFKKFKVGEHVSPVIRTKDGRYIKADAEWNLENIKTGRRWSQFGERTEEQEQLSKLSQEEIDDIMIKIGYVKSKDEYLEEYIKKMDLSNYNETDREKVSRLFLDKEIQKRSKKLESSVDIYRFYRRIIKEEITKDKAVLFGGYSKNPTRGIKKYTVLTYLKDEEGEIFWIWSNKNKRMEKIEKRLIEHMQNKKMLHIIPGKQNKRYQEMQNSIHEENKTSAIKTFAMPLISNPLREIWSR